METFLTFKESVDLMGTSNLIIKCSQIFFPPIIFLGFQQCGHHFVINGVPHIPQRHLQTIWLPERTLRHTLDRSQLAIERTTHLGIKWIVKAWHFFQKQCTFRFLIRHLPLNHLLKHPVMYSMSTNCIPTPSQSRKHNNELTPLSTLLCNFQKKKKEQCNGKVLHYDYMWPAVKEIEVATWLGQNLVELVI